MSEASLLTVVMDLDQASWSSVTEDSLKILSERSSAQGGMGGGDVEEPISLGSALKSVIVMLNAVKLMNRENEVLFIAQLPNGNAQVWHGKEPIGTTIGNHMTKLQQRLEEQQGDEDTGQPSLSLALSMALCRANRAMALHKNRFGVEPQSRILVVQATPDDASQYIASMNAAFAAQKRGILVDVCDFTPKRSSMLQQVAHLTGGILQHYSGISAGAFTEHLFAVFLSNASERKGILRVPPQAPIVLEAACFCHGELKSRGFVCSVCLSVFCRDPSTSKATCPTCKTRVLVDK